MAHKIVQWHRRNDLHHNVLYRPAPINPIAIQIIGRLMETGIDIYYTALP